MMGRYGGGMVPVVWPWVDGQRRPQMLYTDAPRTYGAGVVGGQVDRGGHDPILHLVRRPLLGQFDEEEGHAAGQPCKYVVVVSCREPRETPWQLHAMDRFDWTQPSHPTHQQRQASTKYSHPPGRASMAARTCAIPSAGESPRRLPFRSTHLGNPVQSSPERADLGWAGRSIGRFGRALIYVYIRIFVCTHP